MIEGDIIKQKIYKRKNRDREFWTNLYYPKIKNLYLISNYGRVKNNKGKILKPFKDKDGYLKFSLQGHNKKVKVFSHRLVAIMFLENDRNLPEVNHENVIKDDNYYGNLSWCTRKENLNHSYEHKLQTYVELEKHGMAKVDNDTVHLICLLLENNITNVKIRRFLGIKKSNILLNDQYRGLIKNIKYKKAWKSISDIYNF